MIANYKKTFLSCIQCLFCTAFKNQNSYYEVSKKTIYCDCTENCTQTIEKVLCAKCY